MNSKILPSLAGLLMLILTGCPAVPIQRIKLQAPLPGAAKIGNGRVILVEEFSNKRNMLDGVPKEPGRFTHWLEDLEDQCGDASIGGFFCTEGETPEGMVRNSLCGILENAGFKVLKDASSAKGETLRMKGELRQFYFTTGPAVAGINVPGKSVSGIDFVLRFSKGEDELALKVIHGQTSGRPFMIGPSQGREHVIKYMNKSLAKAMGKSAEYFASDDFKSEVLGIPGVKAHKSPDSDGGDAEGGEEDEESN